METTVSAIQMRRKFGGILDRVVRKGEHITIMRGNVALAVLIPVKEHERQCLDKDRVRKIEEVLAEIDTWKKANPSKARRLARADSTAEIRKMRDTRWLSSTPR